MIENFSGKVVACIMFIACEERTLLSLVLRWKYGAWKWEQVLHLKKQAVSFISEITVSAHKAPLLKNKARARFYILFISEHVPFDVDAYYTT